MKLMNAKGVRDFPPEKKIVRQQITDTLREVFELYGFSPLETPVLERFDVLASKFTGGEEILKETFRLSDQGERDLALRYDLTVPLCRFVAMNPTVKLPFKRYQMERVFRDGPLKKGRYREFWQCDADVVGSKGVAAEAELINLAIDAFKKLNLNIVVKVNNRKILNSIVDYAGIKEKDADSVILSVDKLEKIGKKGVEEELTKKGIKREQAEKLFEILAFKGTFNEKIELLSEKLKEKEGVAEIQELFSYLNTCCNVNFDLTLARGLAYYTGTVYEVFLEDSDITSSVAAGGRYDNMIGNLIGGNKEYPAVGISFGLDVLTDAIECDEKRKSVADVFIIPIGTLKESLKVASILRKKGIRTDIDVNNKNISKNLNYINAQGIPYAAFIGEEENRLGKIKLKNMKTGEESLIEPDKVKL